MVLVTFSVAGLPFLAEWARSTLHSSTLTLCSGRWTWRDNSGVLWLPTEFRPQRTWEVERRNRQDSSLPELWFKTGCILQPETPAPLKVALPVHFSLVLSLLLQVTALLLKSPGVLGYPLWLPNTAHTFLSNPLLSCLWNNLSFMSHLFPVGILTSPGGDLKQVS